MANLPNSLIEVVLSQADVDSRFKALVQILETQTIATLNALLSVISALEKSPGVDQEALRGHLESAKQMGGGSDVDARLYGQYLDLCISRLNPPQK